MGNQLSEMKDEYCNRPPLSEPIDFQGGPQPYNLKAHHLNGPSKVSKWDRFILTPTF